MNFNYYNNDKLIKSVHLQVGKKWNDIEKNSTFLNSIFKKIDDGDGVVEIQEINLFFNLFKLVDGSNKLFNKKSKDNILSEKEAFQLLKKIEKFSVKELAQMEIIENTSFWSLENLKSMYPEDIYKYEINEDKICIKDKKGNILLNVFIDRDSKKILSVEMFDKEMSNTSRRKSNEGHFLWYGYESDNINEENKEQYTKDRIVTLIAKNLGFNKYKLDVINDDRAKNYDYRATGDIKKYIKAINAENIDSVIDFYKEIDILKNEVLGSIIKASDLTVVEKKKYLLHIIKVKLCQMYKDGFYVKDLKTKLINEITLQLSKNDDSIDIDYLNSFINQAISRAKMNTDISKIEYDGKINGKIKQGNTGDCWLLASIIAIAQKTKGLELLNKSLKLNKDGSITVTLKGPNKSYTISKKELNGARELASGDGDFRAIEIAVQRYLEEERKGEITNSTVNLNGNNELFAYYLLLGDKQYEQILKKNKGHIYKFTIDQFPLTEEQLKKINNENVITTVSGYVNKEAFAQTENGCKIKLLNTHVYAVVRVDENFVYLINPHDSSKCLKVEKSTFKDFFTNLMQSEI